MKTISFQQHKIMQKMNVYVYQLQPFYSACLSTHTLGNVNVSEWSSLIKIFSCLQTIAKRGKNINSSSRAFQQVILNYTQKPFILESEDRCIITLIRAVLLTAIYLSIFLSVIFLSFRFIVLFYFVISIISFSPILAVILP